MSKTYRKNVRANVACGDNRDFYKTRRRNNKHAIKHDLRNLVANYNSEDIDDMILTPKIIKKDTWREPTDGYNLINKDILKNKDKETGYDEYYHQKYDKILKNKHIEH